MSFSPHDGFVQVATFADADRPVSAAKVRGVLLNNAIWACEQASQVRVKKMVAREADEIKREASRELVVDTFYPLFRTRFDCHMHPQGGAYRFRVRLAARATQGNSCAFQLIITHPDYGGTAEHSRTYTTSSSTHAWRVPDGGDSNVIEVPFELVDVAVVPQEQKIAIAGNLSSVPTCKLACQVFGSTTNVSSTPAVSGVIVEEYIGQ